MPFFSVSRLPPHSSYRASHVSIMNLGVLVPIYIPKAILKCLCNAWMLTHTEGWQHDSDFLKFNFNFFDSWTALGIISWLCWDGQNSDRNGASLDENSPYPNPALVAYVRQAFIMGKEKTSMQKYRIHILCEKSFKVSFTEREMNANWLWNVLFLHPDARYLSKHLFILCNMIYIINDWTKFKGSNLHIY